MNPDELPFPRASCGVFVGVLSSKILENLLSNGEQATPLLSTLLFFSIVLENRPAKQVRPVTVHEPTFNEQGARLV